MVRIARASLKNAPYNPRQIDERAKKKLRAALKRFGLVQPLVWNKRTGNLVGGHQRVEALDSLERGKEYELDVAAIDVDPTQEKEINILLNNELVMGTFDIPKLESLFKEISFENAGFEGFELKVMLPSFEPPMSPRLVEQTREVGQVVEDIEENKKKGRELRKQIKDTMLARDKDRRPELDDMELYVILVFKNRESSDEFLETLNLPTTEKYISGELVKDMLAKVTQNS